MTPTVKSDRFGIVSNNAKCHACGRETPVKALFVLGGRYRDEPDDDEWHSIDAAALLTYVQGLNHAALAAWHSVAPWVQYTESRTAGTSYWSNTCVHCQALQGDWYLTEADGPFFPTMPDLESNVSLVWVTGPVEAIADVSESNWMDRLVSRHPFGV